MRELWIMSEKRMDSGTLKGLRLVGGYKVPDLAIAASHIKSCKSRIGQSGKELLTNSTSTLLAVWLEIREV